LKPRKRSQFHQQGCRNHQYFFVFCHDAMR
jgi:hypothetical protein